MTVPTGTFQHYQQIGKREDLSDVIYNISPTEKPLTQAFRKVKATNPKHEWQTDELAAASATNAMIDGDDATVNTAVPTTRLFNYLQTIQKTVSVSGKGRATSTAGRSDEFNYQLKKRMAECGRDLEAALGQNNAGTAGAAASAALMASIESWLGSNRTSVGTGTAQTTPGQSSGIPSTAPTDSTVAGTLTEAAVKAVIAAAYNAGGTPSLMVCGVTTKQKISGSFAGIATRFKDVPGKQQATIVSGADLYVSDVGELTLVPSRFVRARTLLILDPEYWAVASMRGFTMERLGKTGDSDKAMIVGDYTLEARQEASSGKVADIDPAL